MLSQDRKDFIDAHFHENLAEQDLSREAFDQLQTPQELAYLVSRHNWDTGVLLMHWVAQSPLCSRATAAEIFWLSQPHEYQSNRLGQRLKDTERQQTFALIQTLLQNYPDYYPNVPGLQFDPAPHIDPALPIPSFMSQATAGETSYVYFDKDDVNSWFESDWLAQISNASTAMELFNIAWFLDELELATPILAHPLCDRGIATLVFWRLHRLCSLYPSAPPLLRQIIEQLDSSHYPAHISYAPQDDPEVQLPKRKLKWDIPPALKQAV